MCRSDIIRQIRVNAVLAGNAKNEPTEGIQYVYEVIRNIAGTYETYVYENIIDFKLGWDKHNIFNIRWFSIYWAPKHPTYVVCKVDGVLDLISIATGSEELTKYINDYKI